MYTGIMIALFAYPVAYVLFQAVCLVRWRGPWKMAAIVPLGCVAAISVVVFADLRENPASHNLWPLEVIVWSAAALAFLCMLSILRGVVQLTAGLRHTQADPEAAGRTS